MELIKKQTLQKTDEECKQVNNTIFDIFSFLLTKE